MGEVSVVTELGKARAIQAQGADHPVRGQVEYSTDSPHQCSVRILSGAVGINAHGHRFRLPNGIGQGDRAPLRQASCYDVLGDVPGHIGAAAIHLRSILPGQRPAPVGDKSAVGIHHELAARQAGVRLNAAQDEAPGGIDEDLCILVYGEFPECGNDHRLYDLPPKFHHIFVRSVLAGDHHAADPVGQAEHILHRHLGFSVRAQAPDRTCLSGIGQQAGQPVGQDDRQREQLLRLRTGVAVHDPLVAGSPLNGEEPAAIYRTGDVRALIVGDDLDLIVGIVSGLTNRSGGDGGDVRKLLGGDLARHDDLSRRGHNLAGHAGGGVLFQAGVQHRVRDGVAQLIRMPLSDRLCGLNVSISHIFSLSLGEFSPAGSGLGP